MAPDLSKNFPAYTDFPSSVPVYCVTPGPASVIHRFFDTSAFSPSGRYLGLTRLPFEEHLPKPGDTAEVLLVDLETGEQRAIAETRGWDTQLGAQVQWGADDESLFFNDLDTKTWMPFGIKMNPFTGKRLKMEGTIYMISPDGKWAASPCLLRTSLPQAGYGVIVPDKYIPRNQGAPSDDGIYLTDTQTGKCSLLVSLAEIFENAVPAFEKDIYRDGDFYGFHIKWNPQGTRLQFVLRWVPKNKEQALLNNVITMNADGSNIRVAVPDSIWRKGGHHPNWCPDGEHISMNLRLHENGLSLVRVRYDGSNLRTFTDAVPGSGHPTLHPDGRHILTDTYCRAPFAFADGTTPIRWIDVQSGEEKHLLRIKTLPDFTGPKNEFRVDPHPAWDRDFKRIAFNACPYGNRNVFVAELESEVKDGWAGFHAVFLGCRTTDKKCGRAITKRSVRRCRERKITF